ncbi:histone-lysine N-methyltransferase 2C [Teleopsis dalmanni]|uniref:histone-lysine N-methyltransferase 2C n=1 Tax=Teleopsis dalmanni TaxID=139649 RepID=UPI0018CEA73F|nr:histone-lysine N-methyltransferase 2C [Teleopsis dalmanni]
MVYPDSNASPSSEENINLEKYPGKVCFLCNLGERSILGQGQFLRLEIFGNLNDVETNIIDDIFNGDIKHKELSQQTIRRIKNTGKAKFGNDVHDLDNVGHSEMLQLRMQCDGTFFYVHQMCAMWTTRTNCINVESLQNCGIVSLQRKCCYCDQYGASITCSLDCKKAYHLPCAAASGCFLVLQTFTAFCNEHLNQVPYHCTDNNVCRSCSVFGDISKLIMCSTCGEHYHTTCIGLVNSPDTRSGWNCLHCSKCQICRQSDSQEGRSLKCEQCQKLYHTTCLRPALTTVPKYGWKCNYCRVCSDCGSRTPGGGTSSRWHCHYTICDSCYQQRNKGFSCPICHKAYRAAAHKEMVKCSTCHRFVHSQCDKEADLSIYHKRKEHNPDYDYTCPHCKNKNIIDFAISESTHASDTALSTLDGFSDKSGKCLELDFMEKNSQENSLEDKTAELIKNSKKRMNFKDFYRGRGGKLAFQKTCLLTHLNRKRGARGRNRILNNGLERMMDKNKSRSVDDDIAMEKRLLFCSTNDIFTLTGDICVSCGSVGIDDEDAMISCAQCGQCYHTYCANVKLSKILLKKGWRCLDCTVCEGCGQKDDEARLILCDECDISYHIYCMEPPLEIVPHGNWKCKLCAVCEKCGRSTPGKNSTFDEYMNCGPCASTTKCSICIRQYNEHELIIQCNSCERWLHCKCDPFYIKNDTKIFDNNEYHCIFCKPNESSSPHIRADSNSSLNYTISDSRLATCSTALVRKQNSEPIFSHYSQTEQNDSMDTAHVLDDVYVTERGLSCIKSLTAEIKRKRKMRLCNEVAVKDEGVEAAIESVVSAANVNIVDDGHDCDSNLKVQRENGNEVSAMGLSGTNSPPQTVRKKRQRNLQKLGIGGFLARNRIYKKDLENSNLPDSANNQVTGQPVNNEKKKKMARKKSKEKLTDTYPSYLQEAFFGKPLLDAKDSTKWESDSSDDFNYNNSNKLVNDAYSALQNKSVPKHNVTATTQSEKNETVNSITIEKQQNPIPTTLNAPPKINAESSLTSAMYVNNFKRTNSYEVQNLNTQLTVEKKVFRNDTAGVAVLNNNCGNLNGVVVMDNLRINQSPKEVIDNNKIGYSLNRVENTTAPVQIMQPTQCDINLNQTAFSLQTSSNTINMDHNLQLQNQNLQVQKVVQKETVPKRNMASEENVESVAAGTQKTAEKMRRDEELGEMATISAVLYANTQFPELKQTYPNWNDRCKQILKKWRSLPTEKKAPFLQHAKDNRSALRLQRIQQFHGKSYMPQKVAKPYVEDIRKQQQPQTQQQPQPKPNEIVTTNDFKNLIGDSLNQNLQLHDRQIVLDNGNKISENVTDPTKTVEFLQNSFQINREICAVDRKKDFENISNSNNKHLRNLLQTQAVYTIPPTNSLAIQPRTITNTVPTNDSNMTHNIYINQQQSQQQTDMLESNISIDPKFDLKVIDNVESSNVAELERIDPDENVGLGDILGGFGEGDDDDLLKSLTTEIGDDFNILEYADPELDELSTNQNILNKLDLDDNEKSTINV